MKEITESIGLAFLEEPFIIKELTILFITALVHFLAKSVLKRIRRVTRTTRVYWDEVIANAALKSMPTLIWVVGISIAGRLLHARYQSDLTAYFPLFRDVGIIVCVAWFFWRLTDGFGRQYLEAQASDVDKVDRTTVDALNKLAHLVVFIMAALTIMQTLGFSISGIVAAGGIGGIAIGFAAKDLLANFFGGLTIYLDRPFNVGDWIRSPDKDIEGVVEKISWRHTRIRRFNKNPIYVPNSFFTTIAVENPSQMSNRRIKEMVGIRYDDIAVMAKIVEDVKKMLTAHESIDKSKTLIVNFTAFSASSVDFMVYTFTNTVVWEEYHEIRQDVLLKVAEIVAKHGAEIAFPTQTLHIAQGAEAG